ncbi:MarR family winged helix-turn-helix transcriptional regulator [Corynebacterium halotolerans]|uniref:Transcription factor n=1 Tax=Corynebacterium halotolerans YIM 70093 = DSM 44683 TaxID=1121362 RepID=M1NLK4_9CORY|nr:MarR family transcriptional regulator [Corynebacterium halotolerans]AGF72288.1 transcription factor [Corynebacterium halotolerans YIM 70093 = DSM 44683]
MNEPVNWLNTAESRTWLALWSVSEWLPVRLDEQLKRDSGVNHRDYFALAQISMAPGEQLSMTELARLSDMSASHLSHVVSRLEKRGWVVRQPSPGDRRTNIASLTEEGRAFLRGAAPGHVTEVRRRVFDTLTEDETVQLGDLLSKVLGGLEPPGTPRA